MQNQKTSKAMKIGIIFMKSRKSEQKISVFEASEMTGLSTNTINKIEQGSRNMSMSSLFLFMTAYEADANTLLDLSGGAGGAEEGIDRKLSLFRIWKQCLPVFPMSMKRSVSFVKLVERSFL